MLEHQNINLTPNGRKNIKPYIHGDTKEKITDLSFEILDNDNIKEAIQVREINNNDDYKLLSEEELEMLLKGEFKFEDDKRIENKN